MSTAFHHMTGGGMWIFQIFRTGQEYIKKTLEYVQMHDVKNLSILNGEKLAV